jgi:hypothetical protein
MTLALDRKKQHMTTPEVVNVRSQPIVITP